MSPGNQFSLELKV